MRVSVSAQSMSDGGGEDILVDTSLVEEDSPRRPVPPPYRYQTDLRNATLSYTLSELHDLYKSLRGISSTNYQTVKHWSPIKGTYIIDPSLSVPNYLVSSDLHRPGRSIGRGVTGKRNLLIEATGGPHGIDADIWLVNSGDFVEDTNGAAERILIDVHSISYFGDIKIKIHQFTSTPFALSTYLNWGNICISLPREFEGPLMLKMGFRGSVTFSKAVEARLMVFSKEEKRMKCFIGDIALANAEPIDRNYWTGSLIDAQSGAGNVVFSFVDE